MISGNARNTEPFGLCSDVFYICIHRVVLSGGDIHERTHMALDKNGKAVIFNDTDTNADTVTAAINVEGYAFSLIYKD